MTLDQKALEAAAAILLGRVNAPEQEIYRAAREAITAYLSALPTPQGSGHVPDEARWLLDRDELAVAAADANLSDGAVRALCLAKAGIITDEAREWAARAMLAAAPTSLTDGGDLGR